MTHAAGTNNVILKPNKFSFPVGNSTVTRFTFENYITYFNPQQTVGVGSTGTHYTLPLTGLSTVQTIENRFVPQQRIYIKNHKFFTGQKLVYNMGIGGTSLVWAKVAAGATSGVGTEVLPDGDVYAINFEQDYIGIATLGFPTTGDAVWFYNVASNSGFAHSLATTFEKVNSKVEKFFGKVGVASDHGLETGDIIRIDALPKDTESTIIRYDPVLAKVTTKRVGFTYTSFSADLTEININDHDLQSGDKVVYYDNGNTIDGLINNETYFVLRENTDFIKLCKYKSDVFDSNPISISTVTTSSANNLSFLAKINPPLDFTPQLQQDIDYTKLDSDLDTIWTKEKGINEKQIVEKKLKRVYNLSVMEITEKVLKTITDILSDLAEMKSFSLNQFIDIFIKGDRLIYVGILSVVMAIILFLISSTSGEISPKGPPALSIKLI